MTATLTKSNTRVAIFPGSFRPFTKGHADIVSRGLEIFDKVIIAVGINISKPKADADALVESIAKYYASEPKVDVIGYSTLTTEFAQQVGANFILRGIRSVKDFEYEREMADINTKLSGIETVLLFSRPELASISSSVVRELQAYGKDVSSFLP